jgi:hypothetical protein
LTLFSSQDLVGRCGLKLFQNPNGAGPVQMFVLAKELEAEEKAKSWAREYPSQVLDMSELRRHIVQTRIRFFFLIGPPRHRSSVA